MIRRSSVVAVVAAVICVQPGSCAHLTAEQLLERVIEAHGGRKQLNEFVSTPHKYSGEVELNNGCKYSCKSERCADGYVLECAAPYSFTDVLQNGNGWTRSSGICSADSATEIRRSAKNLIHSLFQMLLGKDEGYPIKALNEKSFGGKPCGGVRYRTRDGASVDIYYDTETHLVRASRCVYVDADDSIDTTDEYGNFIGKDGCEVPMTIARQADAGLGFVTRWTTIEKLEDGQCDRVEPCPALPEFSNSGSPKVIAFQNHRFYGSRLLVQTFPD